MAIRIYVFCIVCARLLQIDTFAVAHDHGMLDSLVLYHQCRDPRHNGMPTNRAMLHAMAESRAMRLVFLRRLFCSIEVLASQLPPHAAEPPLNRLAADLINRDLVANLITSLQVCVVELCDVECLFCLQTVCLRLSQFLWASRVFILFTFHRPRRHCTTRKVMTPTKSSLSCIKQSSY